MTEPRHLDFYFDFISPYAFLASLRIEAFGEEHGLDVRWHPVLFAALLGRWGQLGPAEIPPKRAFTFRDVARRAALRGVDIQGPPRHPFVPLKALRLSLPQVSGAASVDVARALYRACWVEGRSLEDTDVLHDVLDDIELVDPDKALAAIETDAVKDALKEETSGAIARGVFGVPTMIWDDEVFWGDDQLEMLALVIAGRDPMPPGAASRLESIAVGAKRDDPRTS